MVLLYCNTGIVHSCPRSSANCFIYRQECHHGFSSFRATRLAPHASEPIINTILFLAVTMCVTNLCPLQDNYCYSLMTASTKSRKMVTLYVPLTPRGG